MGRRVTKAVFFAFVFCIALLFFFTASANAQQSASALTFPHFASGDGIKVEVNLTNPAPHIEKGHVFFFQDNGEPMPLTVDGEFRSDAEFTLPAGGAKKLEIRGTETAKTGYAVVVAENAASSLVGNLVFTLNGLFDLSVADSKPTSFARLFVERTSEVNSGYAVLNRGNEEIRISRVIRDQQGFQIVKDSFGVGPGRKVSGFVDSLLEGTDFIGTLELSAGAPFYILGLRQRSTLSLAALPVAISTGPIVGSQLLYFVDSGIDLASEGFSEEELETKTVYELTGMTKPAKPGAIKIVNNNRSQAVTLHVYYLNDKCRDYVDFLLVLKCGETLTFDPFDFEIPGTGGIRTSNILFGYGLPAEMAGSDRYRAMDFGSGRFVLSILAVGAPTDGDNEADILYPNEIAGTMVDVCGVRPANSGVEEGFSRGNLHVYNALPIVFDFLSGNHLDVRTGLDGPIFSADANLQALSLFTRTLVPIPNMGPQNTFVTLSDPGNSDLFDYMARQKGRTAGTLSLPSTAVFTWGLAPFTFLPGGR